MPKEEEKKSEKSSKIPAKIKPEKSTVKLLREQAKALKKEDDPKKNIPKDIFHRLHIGRKTFESHQIKSSFLLEWACYCQAETMEWIIDLQNHYKGGK